MNIVLWDFLKFSFTFHQKYMNLTSFVETSHAISVDDASWPFTKHFISDFVHLYLQKSKVDLMNKLLFWIPLHIAVLVSFIVILTCCKCKRLPTWTIFLVEIRTWRNVGNLSLSPSWRWEPDNYQQNGRNIQYVLKFRN